MRPSPKSKFPDPRHLRAGNKGRGRHEGLGIELIRIQVSHFKSFEKLCVNLSAFNVLMGADATGKSNVVSVLNFLEDITESGLDNAISLQGGVETLGNMRIGTSDLRIQIDLSTSQKDVGVPYRLVLRRKEKGETIKNEFLAEAKLLRYTYGFTIAFGKKSGFRIVEENLEVRFGISEHTSPSSRQALLLLQELTVKARRIGRKFEISTSPDEFQVDSSDIIPKFLSKRREPQNFQRHLVIEEPFSYIPSILTESLRNIAVFDLDPV